MDNNKKYYSIYLVGESANVMLNYQTTGFRETAALRELFGLTAIAPFQAWLEKMGFVENGKLSPKAGDGSSLL